MKILVVVATELEIKPAIDLLEKLGVDVLTTGVGMVATAYQLGRRLALHDYDLVVNVGIAGSFSRELKLGQLVHVIQDSFAELGAEDNERFLSIDQLGFGRSSYRTSAHIAQDSVQSLPKVSGITMNTVHGNVESIATTRRRMPAIDIESMEGAAVFFSAEQAGVPAIQVRAISNYVEPRNRNNWQIPLAVKNLSSWLMDFTLALVSKKA